jgi:hypothetical protein
LLHNIIQTANAGKNSPNSLLAYKPTPLVDHGKTTLNLSAYMRRYTVILNSLLNLLTG